MPRSPRTTPSSALDWRPANYWDHADPVSALLANVKGEVRRTIVKDALNSNMPLPDLEALLQEELSEEERRAWGSCHPDCMGGEYLPGYLPGEIEIARVVFESVTRDVISIRARRRLGGKRILYRVVDEYPEDHHFTFSPRTSAKPLTLRALWKLIWGFRTGDEDPGQSFLQFCLAMNREHGDVASTAGFIGVESMVYGGLAPLAAVSMLEWLQEVAPDELCEEDEEGAA